MTADQLSVLTQIIVGDREVVEQVMKKDSLLVPLMLAACAQSTPSTQSTAAAASVTSAADLASDAVVGVTCSSVDHGKTCYGFGERYRDGTADACGRVPDGPEFALKSTWQIVEGTLCETVTHTSDPGTMPVGERFCEIHLERTPTERTYRFTDDPADRVRHAYRRERTDKWCQESIDALAPAAMRTASIATDYGSATVSLLGPAPYTLRVDLREMSPDEACHLEAIRAIASVADGPKAAMMLPRVDNGMSTQRAFESRRPLTLPEGDLLVDLQFAADGCALPAVWKIVSIPARADEAR